MGGVNLTEESKNILATNSELIGSQIRSCKDETFLPHGSLMKRLHAIGQTIIYIYLYKTNLIYFEMLLLHTCTYNYNITTLHHTTMQPYLLDFYI